MKVTIMKWIDATHLKTWAQRRDCQEHLPYLVRRLIRATTQSIKNIKFPSGDNITIGGWDGVLEVYEETEFLPLGISLWEFGTSKDVKGKADEDYEKRTKSSLGFNPSEATYIFVTPRIWQNKDKWLETRMAEGVWKEIRVYDAEDLEEWIETAPSVGAWLAVKHLNVYPSNGVQATDDFWEEWSTGSTINLLPHVLLGGREIEADKLIAQSASPSIIPVEASSREEATAFILSTFLANEERKEDFFSRSLIVDTPDAFRALMILDKPMFLIIRFDDDSVINRARAKGHCVLVPLGIETSGNWDGKITLPALEREAFVKAMKASGLNEHQAEDISKKSARNIAVLRRQLEFKRSNPEWAHKDVVRELIPAMLVGRWDEAYEEDRNVVSSVAGETYDEYVKKLKKWCFTADSPIVQIGTSWRLTSPLDAWTQAAKYCTKSDFELLKKNYLEGFQQTSSIFELPPAERHRASWYGKTENHSRWLREGLTQSLILVSVFGENLNMDTPNNPISWVNGIIRTLLNTDNPELWKTLDSEMPLIAEASPSVFLNIVEELLQQEKSPILALFEEDPGFMSAHSYHTGLLWALENVAWMPEYLSQASVCMAKLASNDPGGRLSNRPINSLTEIFKPWHPQTLADLDARIAALKLILAKEPHTTNTLLMRLLPSSHAIAHPTHKMRWRLLNEILPTTITYAEIYKTHSVIVDMLIKHYDGTEAQLSALLDKADKLQPLERDKLLTFIETKANTIKHTTNMLWHKLRKELSDHRSHPTAHWSLPEEDLNRYDALYKTLEPTDETDKILWLFNEHWPAFPEGLVYKKETVDARDEKINKSREEALSVIYSKSGLDKIIQLIDIVPTEHAWILGNTSAKLINDEAEIMHLCEFLKEDDNKLHFIKSFIFRKSILHGNSWVFELFNKLKAKEYSSKILSRIFLPLIQNEELWNFIDNTDEIIKSEYWQNVRVNLYNLNRDSKKIGVLKLIEYGRYISAISECWHHPEDFETELLVHALQVLVRNKPTEHAQLNGYEIERIFDELEKRGFDDKDTLIQLEWAYLPLLGSYGDSKTPRLENELAENPDFFIQVLNLIFPSEVDTKESNVEDDSLIKKTDLSLQAYNLLSHWKKIPGSDDSGNIDEVKLNEWITVVREKAKGIDRLDKADAYIATVLAQYPEKDMSWPPDAICRTIENIGTGSIKSNFYSAVYNKRGSSSRSVFEGGAREWEISAYFKELASKKAASFPQLATIFESLVRTYEQEAKSEDERAKKDKMEY